MEGTRRITLVQSSPTGEASASGETIYGPPIPHPVWAVREDKPSAGEGFIASRVEGGSWRIHYTIREESVPEPPTEDWHVLDERGRRLRIEGVFEKNSGPRARKLMLVCVRQLTE